MPGWWRFAQWSLVLILLVGCAIEGGAVIQPTAAPAPTPTAAPTINPEAQGWRLGVTEEPIDLYPYSYNARSAAPLIQLLYPSPLLIVNDRYTTTGVLERVPSFENGDVSYITTTVYLDVSGAITQTQTETITSVRQIAVTYRWNRALTWSDGTPVTSVDSVFAYELLHKTPPTPQLAVQQDLVVDYVALDDYTTRAFLPPARDDPNYLETVWTPLPRHHFPEAVTPAEVQAALGRTPLGYGPYQLEAWSNQLEFGRSPGGAAFSAALPERITVRLFPDLDMLRNDVVAGLTDVGWSEALLDQQLDSLSANPAAARLQFLTVATPVWEHLDFNLAVTALQDLRMRRAIAHAMNREALVQSLYGPGLAPWDSWIAPDSWAYETQRLTRYAYAPDQARQLLDEMGYKDVTGDGLRERPDTQPFSLTVVTSEQTAVRQAISAQLVADLAQVGIQIHVQTLSAQDLYSQQGPLFQRRFELALFGWLRAVDPDGAVLWSCAAIPNQVNNWTGDNFTGWCIDTADQAIRSATDSLDYSIRKAAYADHQAIMTRELPILPLFARRMTVLARPAINGLQPDPFAPLTWNMEAWQR